MKVIHWIAVGMHVAFGFLELILRILSNATLRHEFQSVIIYMFMIIYEELPVTVGAQIRSQANPCGIFGGKSGTRTEFFFRAFQFSREFQ
jgi:hypothetical protein